MRGTFVIFNCFFLDFLLRNSSMKRPVNKNQKFIENFFIKKGLKLLVDLSKKKKPSVNQMIVNEPYIPELYDLYNLYQYVLINKRTTILEFGSGWSTLIFSLALNELANHFSNEVKKLKLGICGEHGGDPKSIDFCSKVGLNYVSCSPYRVPIARLAAAQAELKKNVK